MQPLRGKELKQKEGLVSSRLLGHKLWLCKQALTLKQICTHATTGFQIFLALDCLHLVNFQWVSAVRFFFLQQTSSPLGKKRLEIMLGEWTPLALGLGQTLTWRNNNCVSKFFLAQYLSPVSKGLKTNMPIPQLKQTWPPCCCAGKRWICLFSFFFFFQSSFKRSLSPGLHNSHFKHWAVWLFLFFSCQLLISSLFLKGEFDSFILQEVGQPLYLCSCPPPSGESVPGKDINPGESLVISSHIIPCKYLWKH